MAASKPGTDLVDTVKWAVEEAEGIDTAVGLELRGALQRGLQETLRGFLAISFRTLRDGAAAGTSAGRGLDAVCLGLARTLTSVEARTVCREPPGLGPDLDPIAILSRVVQAFSSETEIVDNAIWAIGLLGGATNLEALLRDTTVPPLALRATLAAAADPSLEVEPAAVVSLAEAAFRAVERHENDVLLQQGLCEVLGQVLVLEAAEEDTTDGETWGLEDAGSAAAAGSGGGGLESQQAYVILGPVVRDAVPTLMERLRRGTELAVASGSAAGCQGSAASRAARAN